MCIITPRVPVRVRQPPGRPLPAPVYTRGTQNARSHTKRGSQRKSNPDRHRQPIPCNCAMPCNPSQAKSFSRRVRVCVCQRNRNGRGQEREREREEGKWETRRGIRRKPAGRAPHSDADIKAGGSGASNRISRTSLDHDRAPRRASSYGTSAPSSFMRRLNSSRLTQPWNPRP